MVARNSLNRVSAPTSMSTVPTASPEVSRSRAQRLASSCGSCREIGALTGGRGEQFVLGKQIGRLGVGPGRHRPVAVRAPRTTVGQGLAVNAGTTVPVEDHFWPRDRVLVVSHDVSLGVRLRAC